MSQPESPAVRNGWRGLLSIEAENHEYARQAETAKPEACPWDGEPLAEDSTGKLRCRFDGWTEGAF